MNSKMIWQGLFAIMLAWALVPASGCSRNVASSASPAVAKQAQFHCPMHPQIVSDKPGECPICGLALVPIENGGEAGKAVVPGLAPVTLTPETRQRMGLTLGAVEKRVMTRSLRLPARIVPDETRQIRVTTKLEGYVDTLQVSATGQEIRKGSPLLTLYSPALIAAQEEFRVALHSGMNPLIEAAHRRLLSWDLTEAQIGELATTNPVARTVTVYAQTDGVVTEKSVLAGQKIMPGESLMVVTDCSVVWAEADVTEADVALVRVGIPVELSFPFWPGKTFLGSVSFLPPGLSSETHTLKARLTVPNADGLIRLGMYADAILHLQLGEQTVVPDSAVMQTGTHNYVFRDEGGGKLMPVEVRIGAHNAGFFEVLAGLAAGDQVVTSANFLVDSESSIRAAIEGAGGGTTP